MGISVIVLTKNSEATLRECLESVSQNKPQEIVVVDGYSTDTTLDIVKEYTDKIYFDEGKGISYARQLGAEMATEEYIFYVDSDVVLSAGTSDVMLAELKMRGYSAIHARILVRNTPGYLGWAHERWKNATRPEHPGEQKATIAMCAALLRRELILKYQFDPSMPNCDDFEISYKLLKEGHKFGISSAYAYHYHSWDLKAFHTHIYRVGIALAEFLLKYKRSPSVIMRYVVLRGLGFPIYGVLLAVRKGDLRLVPFWVFIGFIQTAGFIKKIFSALISALRRAKSRGRGKRCQR